MVISVEDLEQIDGAEQNWRSHGFVYNIRLWPFGRTFDVVLAKTGCSLQANFIPYHRATTICEMIVLKSSLLDKS